MFILQPHSAFYLNLNFDFYQHAVGSWFMILSDTISTVALCVCNHVTFVLLRRYSIVRENQTIPRNILSSIDLINNYCVRSYPSVSLKLITNLLIEHFKII